MQQGSKGEIDQRLWSSVTRKSSEREYKTHHHMMERLKWQTQRREIAKIDGPEQEKFTGTDHFYFSNLKWLYFLFFLGKITANLSLTLQ